MARAAEVQVCAEVAAACDRVASGGAACLAVGAPPYLLSDQLHGTVVNLWPVAAQAQEP